MQRIEEKIVSEYLEENGFLIRSLAKSRSQAKRAADEGASLYAANQRYVSGGRAANFLLFSSELAYIESAAICVHGWFGDKAALATMIGGAEIVKHVETQVVKKLDKWFDETQLQAAGVPAGAKRILVAPVFPAQEPYRSQCIEILKTKGVDGILSFKSMLLDLIDRVDTKQVYDRSELLQHLRVLKVFGLLRDSQMNLGGM